MQRRDGGKGMQLLGALVLMALGWVIFDGDPSLIGWVFVGALLLQYAAAPGMKLGRRGRGGGRFPFFGQRGGRAAMAGGRSRGPGYSSPSASRGPASWSRSGRSRMASPAGARWSGPSPR